MILDSPQVREGQENVRNAEGGRILLGTRKRNYVMTAS